MKAYKSAVFKLHNPSQRKRAMLHGPTFVSFDIDGLDMAYVRGTQSPEPGELTVKDAMAILRGFSGLDIIGGDVVELLPPKDPPTGPSSPSTSPSRSCA